MDLYASFSECPAEKALLVQSLGLDDKLATRYGKLSGGQKQRLIEDVRSQGVTIVLVTHFHGGG